MVLNIALKVFSVAALLILLGVSYLKVLDSENTLSLGMLRLQMGPYVSPETEILADGPLRYEREGPIFLTAQWCAYAASLALSIVWLLASLELRKPLSGTRYVVQMATMGTAFFYLAQLEQDWFYFSHAVAQLSILTILVIGFLNMRVSVWEAHLADKHDVRGSIAH